MGTHLLRLLLTSVALLVVAASPAHAQRISASTPIPAAPSSLGDSGDPFARGVRFELTPVPASSRPRDAVGAEAAISRSARYGIIGALAGAAVGTAAVLSPLLCNDPDAVCALVVPLGAGVGAVVGGFVGALIGTRSD